MVGHFMLFSLPYSPWALVSPERGVTSGLTKWVLVLDQRGLRLRARCGYSLRAAAQRGQIKHPHSPWPSHLELSV